MANGTDNRRKGEESKEEWQNLLRSHAAASMALWSAREDFLRVFEIRKSLLIRMQHYLDMLPHVVDAAAPKLPRGTPRKSRELKESQPYIEVQAIVADCRRLIETTKRKIDRRLPYPNRSLVSRLHKLPLNSRSVGRMQWIAAEYKEAKPNIIDRYREAAAELNKKSEKLIVPYWEYKKKGPDYERACEMTLDPDKLRLLTRQTFKKIKDAYALRLVPRGPR